MQLTRDFGKTLSAFGGIVFLGILFGGVSAFSNGLDSIGNVKSQKIEKSLTGKVNKISQKKEVAPVQKFKPRSLADKISDYINQNTMKCIDLDGSYGCQCVDQAKHFAKKIFGKNLGYFGNAWDGFQRKSMCGDDCQKTIGAKGIKAGDMVFFKPYQKFKNGGQTGVAGHVASVTKTTDSKILVVEQNTRTGKGGGKVGDRVQTNWYYKTEIGGFISFS